MGLPENYTQSHFIAELLALNADSVLSQILSDIKETALKGHDLTDEHIKTLTFLSEELLGVELTPNQNKKLKVRVIYPGGLALSDVQTKFKFFLFTVLRDVVRLNQSTLSKLLLPLANLWITRLACIESADDMALVDGLIQRFRPPEIKELPSPAIKVVLETEVEGEADKITLLPNSETTEP